MYSYQRLTCTYPCAAVADGRVSEQARTAPLYLYDISQIRIFWCLHILHPLISVVVPPLLFVHAVSRLLSLHSCRTSPIASVLFSFHTGRRMTGNNSCGYFPNPSYFVLMEGGHGELVGVSAP